MSQRPPIPEPTKRIIRQEAFFGCTICGNPLIEYAHIIPYEVSQDNRPENLVALCPNHHSEYDLGGFSEPQIRNHKLNPFNRGRDIRKTFNIIGSAPVIEAGTNICNNTPVLLFVDGKNIVTLHKEDNQLMLNASFYDRNNNLVAYIENRGVHNSFFIVYPLSNFEQPGSRPPIPLVWCLDSAMTDNHWANPSTCSPFSGLIRPQAKPQLRSHPCL